MPCRADPQVAKIFLWVFSSRCIIGHAVLIWEVTGGDILERNNLAALASADLCNLVWEMYILKVRTGVGLLPVSPYRLRFPPLLRLFPRTRNNFLMSKHRFILCPKTKGFIMCVCVFRIHCCTQEEPTRAIFRHRLSFLQEALVKYCFSKMLSVRNFLARVFTRCRLHNRGCLRPRWVVVQELLEVSKLRCPSYVEFNV